MAYIDPSKVISPKASVSSVRVIEDKGEGSYSVARLTYDGKSVLACRWNGGEEEPSGHPNSRGIPTWFIIPDEMDMDIISGVFLRAKKERIHIYEELNIIRNLFKSKKTTTEIIVHPLSCSLSILDANLLVELIINDKYFNDERIGVFDMDSNGNKTNNPISKLSGKLHISLLRELV